MSVSQSNSNTVKENILHAAKIRKDAKIGSLLASEIDPYSINARYHLQCKQNYVSERSLNAIISKDDDVLKAKNISFEKITSDTVLFYKQKFYDGEFVIFPCMCEYFRSKVMETKLKSAEEAMNIKSGFIKSKLEKVIECKLEFYSYSGKPHPRCCRALHAHRAPSSLSPG